MDIVNQFSAYPESYSGVDGCISILNQNIVSGKQTEFPFKFRTNIKWSDDDILSAIRQIEDYSVSYDRDNDYWEINTK